MRYLGLLGAFALFASSGAAADDAAAKKELAPTGKLRAAIAWGPAPSGLYALKDATTGQYRGSPSTSGEIRIRGFERLGRDVHPGGRSAEEVIDFGPAYVLSQSTYIVAPGSPIKSVTDANKSRDTHLRRQRYRDIPRRNRGFGECHACHGRGPAGGDPRNKAGRCDAIPLSRDSLAGVAPEIPGSRVLDDRATFRHKTASTTLLHQKKKGEAANAVGHALVQVQ